MQTEKQTGKQNSLFVSSRERHERAKASAIERRYWTAVKWMWSLYYARRILRNDEHAIKVMNNRPHDLLVSETLILCQQASEVTKKMKTP